MKDTGYNFLKLCNMLPEEAGYWLFKNLVLTQFLCVILGYLLCIASMEYLGVF